MYLTITNLHDTTFPVLQKTEASPVMEALFRKYPHPFVPVVDSEFFVGVVYREDFRKSYLDEHGGWQHLISSEVITLSIDDSLDEARELFDEWGYGIIPVVWPGGFYAGMLRREDLEKVFSFL